MSIADSIGQFRVLSNDVPSNDLRAVIEKIDAVMRQGMEILGDISAAGRFSQAAEHAKDQVADVAGTLNNLRTTMEEIADNLTANGL